ncbi:uncharacterized protein LOC143625723 [Bidens hawaiensis]|uniref:uncharacterized protein LOC143625723 n=1 Tax=Bidens hawaiensis TaxID=980011 RepID=UPI00404A4C20
MASKDGTYKLEKNEPPGSQETGRINFWSEAVAAACYTLNQVLTVKRFGKTCFELLNRRKPNLKWLEPFGSICTVLEPTGKFGPKSMEGFFVGYASPLKRVYLPSLHMIVQVQNVDCQRYTPTIKRPGDSRLFDYESLWVSFQLPEEESSEETLMMIYNQQLLENQEPVTKEPVSVSQNVPENVQSDDVPETVPVFDDDGDTDEEIIEAISPSISHAEENVTNLQTEVSVPLEVVPRTVSYHPEENIIEDLNAGVEPKTYKEALTEESWVNAMQEELMQFEKLGVWRLVDLPEDKKQINTKWVFKCKRDENGIIVRNKARLVVLGFNQRECINYNEVYAPVARGMARNNDYVPEEEPVISVEKEDPEEDLEEDLEEDPEEDPEEDEEEIEEEVICRELPRNVPDLSGYISDFYPPRSPYRGQNECTEQFVKYQFVV